MTMVAIDQQTGEPLTSVDQNQDGAPISKAPSATETPEQSHVSLMWRWGKMMAASGFFQDSRGAAQAAVKIQAGHELGLPPAASMRGIYVFDGKISLSAAVMASKVNESPNYEYEVVERTNDRCVIKWFGKSKRTGGWRELGESKFDNEDVKRAGLESRDNHKKYPAAMKFARALSAGCRTYCPDVFNGAVYGAEEIGGERVTIDETGNVLAAAETNNQLPAAALVGSSNAIADAVRASRVAGSKGPPAPPPVAERVDRLDGDFDSAPTLIEAQSAQAPQPAPAPFLLQRVVDGVAEDLGIPKAVATDIQRAALNGARLTQANHQAVIAALRDHAEGAS